jgi:hypothetical protein
MEIGEENTCPYCGVEFEYGASACPSCDLPLLTAYNEDNLALDRRSRIGMLAVADRRPRPEYSTGDLRCVVVALNQAEADMLEDMLRTEGIPCVVRRSGRADVPDFLAAGRREILVPEGGLAAARDLLQIEPSTSTLPQTSPIALAAAVFAGFLVIVVCVALIASFA